VPEPARNYAKPFAIGGFIVGEIIMLLTVLAPNLKGSPAPPLDAQVMRVVVGSIFFGPFGMAAGTGVGLLFSGLLTKIRRWKARGVLEDERPLP
jgi:hypothetical protein